MSYDPAEPMAIDRIRGRVLDTTNDPLTEYLPDVTYQAIIDRYAATGLPGAEARAGAEIAGRIAAMIAAKPVAIGSEGDSIRWSDKRAEYIKAVRDDFLAEADEADGAARRGRVITVTSEYRTGALTGDRRW